ncbi:MAG: hypothetical protein M4579_005292 [Chaenotheca gracillima]|nr:MAG: hypothetical protein M4579_005292 [Chaenotheca gracillima]
MADDGSHQKSSFPLRGVTMCCTSISPEKRDEVTSCAREMGAVHTLDLTSNVTHLLVGSSDTPKYQYVAKERPDVKVLYPAFIDAVRTLWIQGEEIDREALEEQYRLPVFVGLRICLTGFDDPTERQMLQTLITSHGGSYHGDLTKTITHLVANKPEGDKYKYAAIWNLKVVSVEWLSDSVTRGMILEEALYSLSLPKEERGKNAWIRRVASESTLGKRPRADGPSEQDLERDLLGRRKLRRTASNKLRRQNSGIWDDIVGGATSRDGTPSSARDKPDQEKARGRQVTGLQHAASRGNIHEPEKEVQRSYDGADAQPRAGTADMCGIFQRSRIYLHGFDSRQSGLLSSHLASNDALVFSSLSDLFSSDAVSQNRAYYIVIPHTTPLGKRPDTSSFSGKPMFVTEWWVELCLHRKRLIDPSLSVVCRPFPTLPIKDFDGLVMCSTSFSGIDLLHLSRVVQLMGAVYDQFLLPRTSVLICNTISISREKLLHASEWSVPTVSAAWLWDSIEAGKKMPFDKYIVAPIDRRVQKSIPAADASEMRQPQQAHEIELLDNEGPLAGCVSRVGPLRKLAESLGAELMRDSEVKESGAASLTHLVYRTKRSEAVQKEYEAFGPSQSCVIVPPDWLHACADLRKRPEESRFPKLRAFQSNAGANTQARLTETNNPISRPPSVTPYQAPSDISPPTTIPTAPITSESAASSTTSTNLQNSIAALLAHQQQHNSSSANGTSATDVVQDSHKTKASTDQKQSGQGNSTRRKPLSRLLGRAPSNSSGNGTGAGRSLSRASSADSNVTNPTTTPFPQASGNGAPPGAIIEPPEPSQKLLYDDPEGREQRERVLRKMGRRQQPQSNESEVDNPRREAGLAPSIGVVTDKAGTEGIGTRTRASARGRTSVAG